MGHVSASTRLAFPFCAVLNCGQRSKAFAVATDCTNPHELDGARLPSTCGQPRPHAPGRSPRGLHSRLWAQLEVQPAHNSAKRSVSRTTAIKVRESKRKGTIHNASRIIAMLLSDFITNFCRVAGQLLK
ncbi:unnamed protein product [Mesocestoides corti]|uniref:Secreted protein n=1 Tax=Mesocestoides corti TaxID=53468 RepID=A0A0R3UH94_MESCO|nr:unnamed protein product [Mesocestoides corti]